jgi:hypothetical protein
MIPIWGNQQPLTAPGIGVGSTVYLSLANDALLTGTTTESGQEYLVMVQRSPTPNPMVGVLLEDHPDIVLSKNGDEIPLQDQGPEDYAGNIFITAGDTLTLTITVEAFELTSRAQGPHTITLIVKDGATWRVGAYWTLIVNTIPPVLNTRKLTLASDAVMLAVYTPDEQVNQATLTTAGGTRAQQWAGDRDALTGERVFFFTLTDDPFTEVATAQIPLSPGFYVTQELTLEASNFYPIGDAAVIDQAGNTTEKTVDLTPDPNKVQNTEVTPWAVPFWLPDGEL